MATKITGTVLPVSRELLDDACGLDIGRFLRDTFLYGFAHMAGRVEVRGGGWYRLDGEQFRGWYQVAEELIRLAGEGKA